MHMRKTEQRDPRAAGLDLLGDADILAMLAKGQAEAATVVAEAIPQIVQAAALMAKAIGGGGRLVYVAAGSSGLMALADALELPGTFGIERRQIVVQLAGGMAALSDMRGGPEDDAEAGRDAIAQLNLGPEDCLIALTASGQTPYPLAAAETARAAGAATIGIANNADAMLFGGVEVAVCMRTPPEVIAGSTRMGAGTAQKIALNMMSTLMAIRLGHVHDGFMVNVVADNEKLRERARAIVCAIAEVDGQVAGDAISRSGGAVKPAILMAMGADAAHAAALLRQHGGMLRPAIAELRQG